MRKIFLIGLILLSQLLAQVPEWAKTYNHKKYPAARYFLGVGVAQDQAAAIELARADLAKQIQVRIESELESIESELQEGDRVSLKSQVTAKTKSVVTETIAGIQIVEKQKVKNNYYILAALNKAQYLAGLEVQMSEILEKTNQLISSARELSQQGRIQAAVNNFLDAQNIIPEFYTKSALYTALTGTRYPNHEQFTAPGILAELRAILSKISLQIISGEGQEGSAGKPLPAPIVLRVGYQTDSQMVGVANFPVVAQYQDGNVIQRLTSADDGQVVFNITAVATDPSSTRGRVRFRLDIDRLPEIFKSELQRGEVIVDYTLKTANLVFSINIPQRDAQLIPSLGTDLQQLVVNNGFAVSPTAPYCLEGTIAIVNQKEISTPAGAQYLVEVRLRLNLRENNSKQLLNSIEVSGKGLDTQSIQGAIDKAYRNARIGKEKLAAFLQSAANK